MKITIEIPNEQATRMQARVDNINANRKTTFTVESFLKKRLLEVVDNQTSAARQPSQS